MAKNGISGQNSHIGASNLGGGVGSLTWEKFPYVPVFLFFEASPMHIHNNNITTSAVVKGVEANADKMLSIVDDCSCPSYFWNRDLRLNILLLNLAGDPSKDSEADVVVARGGLQLLSHVENLFESSR